MSERLKHKRSHKMMTRSKKTRTAAEDPSCPQNSNDQECSAIPDNQAAREVVPMHHDVACGGLDDDCRHPKPDYLQVAWLLREKLNDLVDGDKPGELLEPEVGLRSLLDMAASLNIVSADPKMLNPVLWRTLPKELLLLVFASLPVPDITRLRSLSREWRRDLATVNSDINQACHEASPTMVALISHSSADVFFVTIYDLTKCRWKYAYHLHLQRPRKEDWEKWPLTWTTVDACSGGLVCFLSVRRPTKHDRLCIVVVNVFTRVQRELPPPQIEYCTLPAMVHIKVDADTKGYKVFVAAYVKGLHTVEIYDSGTRQWTRAAPAPAPPRDSIFGRVHNWTGLRDWCCKFSSSPGIYDFARGKLERYYKKDTPSTGKPVIDSVLGQDRMFLLQPDLTQLGHASASASHGRRMVFYSFFITEYQLENHTTKAWVQGKSYECPSFAQDLLVAAEKLSNVRLLACDGFLMVIVHHRRISRYFWLLDLSTGEWRNLPEHSTSQGSHKPPVVLCRAFWNVVP